MTLSLSDWQSKSYLDSICNPCNAFNPSLIQNHAGVPIGIRSVGILGVCHDDDDDDDDDNDDDDDDDDDEDEYISW